MNALPNEPVAPVTRRDDPLRMLTSELRAVMRLGKRRRPGVVRARDGETIPCMRRGAGQAVAPGVGVVALVQALVRRPYGCSGPRPYSRPAVPTAVPTAVRQSPEEPLR